MLDNMGSEGIRQSLELIPKEIETEISGGVSLENISELAELGADFISVGRLTHSAPASDFSMRIDPI
jgi:nicotinate-nucleotide pyrophosphorylase (carboxylating)